MKFSYNAVWDRTLALLGAHAPLVGAIAGVFIFLPYLLLGYFVPAPQGSSANLEANSALVSAYLNQTWYWWLIALVAMMLGAIAILILVLDHRQPTVGAAIVGAFRVLPYLLLAWIIVAIGLTIAAVLCSVPFALVAAAGVPTLTAVGSVVVFVLWFYANARFAVMASVASLEHLTPLGMIKRTWELTRGHGWAILGLLFLISIAGLIGSLAIAFVVGGLLRLLLDPELADFLILLVTSALNAALLAILILTTGAIYRELSGSESTASLFD